MIKIYSIIKINILVLLLVLISVIIFAQETRQLAVDKPQAVADLKTSDGAELVSAKWYVQPAHIVEANFKSPGASATDMMLLYPTGASIKTHTIHPQINANDFDKGFMQIKPADLEMREGMGLVSLAWYKVDVTIPETIGSFKTTTGTTAVFEIVMDDYSEIWVNGKQMHGFGQSGNGVIPGYNTRNRVILTDNAKPGDKFSVAILGINGPLGMIPDNYIWIRNAVIDFYKELPANKQGKDIGKIYTIDDKLNSILSPGTKIEKVADGFSFTEGPVWHPDGYLLFSDPNTNTIYRYDPKNYNVTVYMSHSGYTGADIGEYGQPGSNGLAIDKEGRLIIDQHGN
ncbi:MAG: hypothetical protein ABJA71_08255, partial [Ginsengibacter sp.]